MPTQYKKKSRIPGLFLYLGILLAAFILLLGVDFIKTGDNTFEAINEPSFYISNILTDTALVCVTFGTVYLYLDWFKINDPRYLTAENILTEFAQGPTNVPTILSRFLEGFNRKRKILQYKHNIKEKIYLLEKHKRFSDSDLHVWNYGTEEEKQKNYYCRTRKMYEDILKDEYIEQNIDNTRVSYDRVTPAILLNNYYVQGYVRQANDFVTKNENGKIIAYRGPRLILSFGATFLLASLTLDTITVNWLALITVAGKLLTVAVTAYTSYRYAKRHSITITRHDIEFRSSIITEYNKWLKQEATKHEETTEVPSTVESPLGPSTSTNILHLPSVVPDVDVIQTLSNLKN